MFWVNGDADHQCPPWCSLFHSLLTRQKVFRIAAWIMPEVRGLELACLQSKMNESKHSLKNAQWCLCWWVLSISCNTAAGVTKQKCMILWYIILQYDWMSIVSDFRTFSNRDVYISTVEINPTVSVKYRGHCIRDLDGTSLFCNCRFYSLSETVLDASSANKLHWGSMEYVSVCLSVGEIKVVRVNSWKADESRLFTC